MLRLDDPVVLRKLREIRSVLGVAYAFFEYRDLMNAAVHCQQARWSPITDEVTQAIEMVNDLLLAAGERGDG